MERGKAYKALLEAKNRNGQHDAAPGTFGEIRQRYNARQLVAEFFNVSEYEIRKAVKLTRLIPELLEILENSPKRLLLSCADLIADYDAESQTAFAQICAVEERRLNLGTMRRIVRQCPPPAADADNILAVWNAAGAEENRPTKSDKITFDRKKFAPLLDKLGGNVNLEELFLEFLRQTVPD